MGVVFLERVLVVDLKKVACLPEDVQDDKVERVAVVGVVLGLLPHDNLPLIVFVVPRLGKVQLHLGLRHHHGFHLLFDACVKIVFALDLGNVAKTDRILVGQVEENQLLGPNRSIFVIHAHELVLDGLAEVFVRDAKRLLLHEVELQCLDRAQ